MRSNEQLQKHFLGIFFEGFEVVDRVIIKERYSPLFGEMMRLNKIILNSKKQERTFAAKGKSKVIKDDELGAYRDLNPD